MSLYISLRTGSLVPSLDVALEALGQLHFVGVVDLYEESWCVLFYRLSSKLPKQCSCSVMPTEDAEQDGQHGSGSRRQDSSSSRAVVDGAAAAALSGEGGIDTAGLDLPHADHGVDHGLSWEELPSETAIHIDEITQVDRQLFRAAFERFVRDAREVEAQTHVTILCADRLARVRERLAYSLLQ